MGHECPRQNAIQKKVAYVIVTGTAWSWYGLHKVYYMELSQGQIIYKPNK